jgi:LmbE family N-acetylglucosaminyl deacetylase
MQRRAWRLATAFIAVLAMTFGSLFGVLAQQASPVASPMADQEEGAVDLDVLFIGAHPDDEAFGLATYGQWNEYEDIEVGVITVTRGEGGGNAAGTEEGPALGLLREGEERRAVGVAGIEHIYNLDKVDFYYTVSAPLTEQAWDYDQTLERVVRVIRQTTPEVITTMNPSPTPGNHGHHQVAARLAIAAYTLAGDPNAYPEHMSEEGLKPWSVSKIFQGGGAGEDTPGPDCASTFQKAEPTDQVFGVWSGTESERNDGRTWAAVARDGQRTYVSQGWGVFPDASEDPNELGCGYFTLVDSRVPYTVDGTEPTSMLEGASVETEGGLPLGTQFYLTTDTFEVLPGSTFEATAHVWGEFEDERSLSVELAFEDAGWSAEPLDDLAASDEGFTQRFTITVPETAEINTRARLTASLTAGDGGSGSTVEVVQIVPPVIAEIDPLPNVAAFDAWVVDSGQPQLNNLIVPSFSIGIGQTRDVAVTLTNVSDAAQSGSVNIELPTGFTVAAANISFEDLAPGASEDGVFTIENADPSLPTSNEGGEEGNYPVTLTTTIGETTTSENVNLNFVPLHTVQEAPTAPDIDGEVGSGEYPGQAIDLSRVWEGDDPESSADASGSANITWGEDGIFFSVAVTDDTLGTVLPEADAKRHWRTDSVEIAIDPLGTSENTSTTFKVGIFPTTQEGEPAAYRDADAFQGPVGETAPGFDVASSVSEPYSGYVIEAFVPYDVLPADIDPEAATINIFIYDSDTEDLTGQTRLGWSTWNGVQGDPYRWGKTPFDGYEPPADARTTPDEPVIPDAAAQSVNSPWSIMQSSQDGVSLAGKPAVTEPAAIRIDGEPTVTDGLLKVTIGTGEATGNLSIFAWDGEAVIASNQAFALDESSITFQLDVTSAPEGWLLIGFETDDGAVQAIAVPYGE